MWNRLSRVTAEAGSFLRFAAGLRGYFREPLLYEDAERLIVDALRRRESRFLQLVRRAIYDFPDSPYRALLEWAGVEYGDVERMVLADGIESAMECLYDAGVHVSLDELKGRRPIERRGLSIPVDDESFDNPLLAGDFEVASSGSTGKRRRMKIDLSLMVGDAAFRRIVYRAHDIESCVFSAWRGVPPDSSGMKQGLCWSKMRLPIERWFTPVPVSWKPPDHKYALMTHTAIRASRLWTSTPIPAPQLTPLDDASPVVEWLSGVLASGRRPFISTAANNGVRIATRAKETGIDLSGAVFRLGGEPITEGKARVIQGVGGYVFSGWAMSETGPLAGGCPHREAIDEAHLNLAKIALFQRSKKLLDGETTVDALFLTTISRSSPKILLNVDTGDYGVLRERRCGCLLDHLGFRTQLRTIRNYEKLTAGGIQFLGPDVIDLVEQALPEAFGGGPTDYQLVEEESADGAASKVYLVVSPRLGAVDEQAVVQTALKRLAGDDGGRLMSSFWRQAGTLEVVRREPYVTASAKTPPLRVLRK